jgi:DUF438 domain-containing protein
VQDCLEKAKADRKALIRYIQLIDNDSEGDYIGTLIATNEQVRYDSLLFPSGPGY